MQNRPDSIATYFRNEWRVLLTVTVSGLIYNIGLLAGPYFQGKLIDEIARGSPLSTALFTAAVFVSVILFVQAARAVKRFYVRRFANNVNARMQNTVYAHIVAESEDSLLREGTGALMTKAVSDVDACVEGMRKFTTELFDTGVFLVSYLVTLFMQDWKLTFFSCLSIPVALFIAGRLRKLITGYTAEWRKSTSALAERTYECVNNAMLYRICGREDDNFVSYQKMTRENEKKAVLANVWENSMMPVYRIIALTGIVAVIVYGSKKVIASSWSIGQFSAYLLMYASLAEKASHAGKLFNSVQKAAVSWRRVKPFLSDSDSMIQRNICVKPRCAEPANGVAVSDCAKQLEAELKKVSFAWPDGKNLFSSVSFAMRRGQIIGVTGPVACGKSSLAGLFLGGRIYGGSIKIQGAELSSLESKQLVQLVSYMGHESSLMTDTIYNNITFGAGGNIDEVLETVCFTPDLQLMENGIETVVGNGGIRLSGGQQERIALARALYRKTPLIILDDPFASVDKSTEAQILKNMRAYCPESAVLLISHRLAQFPLLDGILLLESPTKTRFSTHEKLLASSAMYRRLFELQSCSEKTEAGE